MCDLQGPKIRIGKFADGKVELEPGQSFVLDADCVEGDATRVGLDYKELVGDVEPGAVLLLDDGLIKLEVVAVEGSAIRTRVVARRRRCPTTRASTARAAACRRRR